MKLWLWSFTSEYHSFVRSGTFNMSVVESRASSSYIGGGPLRPWW